MIENVRTFTRNTAFSLLPLQGKSVSATVPYFRSCVPVLANVLQQWELLHCEYNLFSGFFRLISGSSVIM